MTPWETWCAGVIAGIGEPDLAVGVDTHWAWSNAETAPYDLMRWNNPQNSTEPWPNARDSGAQPGAHDVKIYATIQDGIDATVYTLLREPYYPAIVANLRAGLPRQQWGAYSTAGTELHAWGTGTNWLQSTYGPAPGILTGDDMTPQESQMLADVHDYGARLIYALGVAASYVAGHPELAKSDAVAEVLAAIHAIPSNGAAPLDAAAVAAAVNALLAPTIAAAQAAAADAGKSALAAADAAARIEAALKQA